MRSVLPPSQALTAKAAGFADLISRWDDLRASSLLTGDVDVVRLRPQSELVRAQHGVCRVAEPLESDGALRTTVRLACDRGALTASLAIDARSDVINQVTLSPVSEGACVAR